MAEFTLRENADRYLLGKITFERLYEYMDADIIEDFRYGVRDPEESALAGFLFGMFCDSDLDRKIYGEPDEEEFRRDLAAHFYMEQLNGVKTREKKQAKAVAS